MSNQLVGQEDLLEQLWQTLRPEAAGSKTALLPGPAGVETSHLALYFPNAHKDTFSSVTWVSARSEELLQNGLSSRLLRYTDLGRNETRFSEDNAKEAIQWLGMEKNHRWLLILDAYGPSGESWDIT
ncbi:hypothetical protein BDV06DRAFT_203348 [Aspergillus oleicola]